MKIIYATACGIGAFFALNCGSGDATSGYPASASEGTSTSPSEASADDVTKVAVNGHDFDPPEVRIKAGGSVRWVWVAGRHNVVSGNSCTPDGKFSSGSDTVGPGATFEQKFETAGTFSYYCDPHCGIGMTGKVIVE